MVLAAKVTARGRPRTINREHILDVAMQAYWDKGVDSVSINYICKQAKVAKPGLYREFGNEDGLMKEVLIRYQHNVIEQLITLLQQEITFAETIELLIEFVTQTNDYQPKGCLLVKMSQSREHLGEESVALLDVINHKLMVAYEKKIEQSRIDGHFNLDISTQFCVIYISSQLGHALSLLARGEDADIVKQILQTAFSVFD